MANFEVEARKLDNKVWMTLIEILRAVVDCYIQVLFIYRCVSFIGFLWEVRPLPGILQADWNWMAAGSQDRGKHSDSTAVEEGFNFLYKYYNINLLPV